MTREEKAISLFDEGFNCAQSVFAAFADVTGIDAETAKGIAVSFGGGFGRLQETCGAVSGALLVIGSMRYDTADLPGSKEKAYAETRKFIEDFQGKNGSFKCRDLIGHDFSTDEGMKKVREMNLFDTVCKQVIRDACALLEKNL
ncbi:MAG: C_GCAxxG_C_C family protein [Spirochaetales bacterium]|nr:C_GCAxxG_C_C family protein [Spirochaetales bacterium]